MLGDWQVWTSALPREKCEEILDSCRALTTEQAKVGAGDSSNSNRGIDNLVDLNLRRTRVAWVPVKGYEEIYGFIDSFARRVNRDYFGFDISHGLQEVQFSVYDSKQLGHYDWHQDVFFTAPRPHQRKLSLVIQLSDPESYEGGEFEFRDCHKLDHALFKPQGSVLAFPSFHYHKVNEVTKGIRYTIVAWIDGPKWK